MSRCVVFHSAVFVPIPIVNRFRACGGTSYFGYTSGFRNPFACRSTRQLISANWYPCFWCLNTTVDTSNWEKFDIQRFWIFQQQEICNFFFIDIFGDNLWLAHQILVSGLFFRRLPPFTLWMDFPEAVKQIYPFVPRAFHSLLFF